MRNESSAPFDNDSELGYVGISLHRPNKVRLIHAPEEVIRITESVVAEMCAASGQKHCGDTSNIKDKNGSVQIKLPQYFFAVSQGKDAATLGKLFMIRLFEEMYTLGYDIATSSDLTREVDHSTLFFVKAATKEERRKKAPPQVVCVAPGGVDKLALLRATSSVTYAIKQALVASWAQGVQVETSEEICGEMITKFKLKGRPWCTSGSSSTQVESRRMMLALIGQLSKLHYRLLSGVNLKGGADSLFFIHDPTYLCTETDFCMISLDKNDRLRLINCSDMAHTVKNAILHNGNVLQHEKGGRGYWEFRVKGTPWCCVGQEAVESRRIISRISETMLAHGWALSSAFDMTRSVPDASVFLFTTAPSSPSTHVASISLASGNHIRLVDFPRAVGAKIRDAFVKNYAPETTQESQIINGQGFEMDVNASKRCSNISCELQATSALLGALKVANLCGWRVVACAENGIFPRNVNTWYLVNSTKMPENESNDQLANEHNIAKSEHDIAKSETVSDDRKQGAY
eukprot:GEMP01023736.1.p1 GENE.GEMP01023736.1~~GEMP01023736.1.p1  ORF type:complete len:546 (+),score=109.84 GEMP01023736.1:89-1639(+)